MSAQALRAATKAGAVAEQEQLLLWGVRSRQPHGDEALFRALTWSTIEVYMVARKMNRWQGFGGKDCNANHDEHETELCWTSCNAGAATRVATR